MRIGLCLVRSVLYSGQMRSEMNKIGRQLANRIKAEREALGWSLAELAQRSGVSKAMISKIERGESSPTATVLGHLSGAFRVTLSTLLARAEGATTRLAKANEQAAWRDPATGFRRIAVSPEGASIINIVRCALPPGASVAYPASSYAFINQQIWMLKGTLHFIEGAEVHELRRGDCLQLGSPTDCRFENRRRGPCEYVVVVARHQ
jgi:transcriptional regulator with XRE-family HTH domain